MGKSCNSEGDHLLAQTISNVAVPVEVRMGISSSFAEPWISNTGLFHNEMEVFNNTCCVLCYLRNGEQ